MSVTESETQTFALTDVGCDVPDETTVGVRELTEDVLEVTRNGHIFTVEIGLGRVAEVTLRDETRPERVPGWLSAIMTERFDVREVRL